MYVWGMGLCRGVCVEECVGVCVCDCVIQACEHDISSFLRTTSMRLGRWVGLQVLELIRFWVHNINIK